MFRAIAICLLCSPAFAESLSLEWLPRDGAVSYALYWGAPNYTNRIITTGTSATINGLVPGATYHFAVTYADSLGRESEPTDALAYHVPMGSVTVVYLSGSGTISNAPTILGPWTWLADLGGYGAITRTSTVPFEFYLSGTPKEFSLFPLTINAVKQ